MVDGVVAIFGAKLHQLFSDGFAVAVILAAGFKMHLAIFSAEVTVGSVFPVALLHHKAAFTATGLGNGVGGCGPLNATQFF